ncbi:NAD(P)H-quinone oxidoreductase subunit S, chloroplastic-like [Selaginella moellendorffii]|uniref:NAD(P)H-quinone oxidoreductase subunit S, chloroplastic-like n=1 Tax=Selaginella moellendorffii TaxID=88036 RepID=UPI000D1C87B0|nr:NAD(P)H-quinone oxidoreductase subunit S, chloroplastic-like [Selaginella moellendorffii]|eukprot:XP_024537185.1 NAD(P)H-quinone oxidoreductase subunit S, chloroplastic-like [Selaginella moellendorffii]
MAMSSTAAALSPAFRSRDSIWGEKVVRPIYTRQLVAVVSSSSRKAQVTVRAQGFNFWEILGGRGLGEDQMTSISNERPLFKDAVLSSEKTDARNKKEEEEDGDFEKELGGLTGGFPGGETGLIDFLLKNPPPAKPLVLSEEIEKIRKEIPGPGVKPRPAPPPLLMPGMTVIVKNPKNPYYMYTGILQRVTDGRAGILLEGGCWDKMLAIELKDLERSKPPPMTNPKSAILLEDEEK